jgi:hypothetical protein
MVTGCLMANHPIATRADGTVHDMPPKHQLMQFDMAFSADEMTRIQAGFIPQSTADKWFIYYDNETLFIHRNGTGHCIYKANFKLSDEQYMIQQVIVNRDPLQNAVTNPDFDRDIFPSLLRKLLLNAQ